MEKINEKDGVRSRYAKLQPIANRINGLQDPSYHRNGHQNKFSATNLSVDSYALQLQRDFEDLLQKKNRANKEVSRKTDNTMREEVSQTKMSAALLERRLPSLEISPNELLKKQKDHKRRNKEKRLFSFLLNLKVELFDILNCIFYILWCPIYYFGKLILTIVTSFASLLWSVLTLSMFRGRSLPCQSTELTLVVKEPELSMSPEIMSDLKDLTTDMRKLLSKENSDFHSTNGSLPQGLKTSSEIGQTDRAEQKGLENLLSPQKKFNLSLKMIDEMRVGEKIKGDGFQLLSENYYRYSPNDQNVSSVGLINDYLSDKCSGKFYNIQERRKRCVKQCKEPLATVKNSTFKEGEAVIDYKRRIHSKNSHIRSEFRLSKNSQVKLSHVKKFQKENPDELDPNNSKCPLAGYNSLDTVNTDEKSLSTLLTNLRSKRGKKPRLHSVPVSSVSNDLEKRSPTNGEECEERAKNSLPKSEMEYSKLQQLSELSGQETTGPKFCLDDEQDQLQKNAALVPPQVCHNKELIPESKDSCIVTHKDDLDNHKYAMTVSDHTTQLNQSEKLENEMQTSTLEGSEKKMLQSKGIIEGLKRLTDPVESSGLPFEPRASLRIAKYTQPVDAKSKWLEMKKKFYGIDYNRTEKREEPKKLETKSLAHITSVSKLPAHKIFQYNMQVGRARQMGAELPSAEGILLEKNLTSIGTEGSAVPDRLRRNASRSLQPVVQTPRRLSHTQSLSQWPLDTDNSPLLRKYLPEQKPKPKPRTEVGLIRGRVTSTDHKISTATSAGLNSSVSTSDVTVLSQKCRGNHRHGLKRETDPKKDNPENLLHIEPSSSEMSACNTALLIDFMQRYEMSQKNSRQDHLSQVQSTAGIVSMNNTYSSNNVQDNSLLSFAHCPLVAPRKYNNRNSKTPHNSHQKFLKLGDTFNETAIGDSS